MGRANVSSLSVLGSMQMGFRDIPVWRDDVRDDHDDEKNKNSSSNDCKYNHSQKKKNEKKNGHIHSNKNTNNNSSDDDVDVIVNHSLQQLRKECNRLLGNL